MKSYFLTEKEGRRPLQKAMIQALLPTDSEAPKLQKKEEKKDAKKEEKKVSAHFPFRAIPQGERFIWGEVTSAGISYNFIIDAFTQGGGDGAAAAAKPVHMGGIFALQFMLFIPYHTVNLITVLSVGVIEHLLAV